MGSEKVGLMFPGQGAQYIGMGKEFYDAFPSAKKIFELANNVLGFSLTQKMFEGNEEELRQTEVTQPAVFTVNIVCGHVLFERVAKLKDSCSFVCGHSLGEYSAIVTGKVLDFESGLRLVQKRGEFIQTASKNNPGTMAAIIGLDNDKIREICKEASLKDKGVVEPVNYNCPGQVVIAGRVTAVEYVCQTAKEAGASKTILLNVSGPFHSGLMQEAADLLETELKNYQFNDAVLPVVCNYDAQSTVNGNEIKQKLVKQINHPVLWENSVRKMLNAGTKIFIELGPGRVLSGLVKRIDRDAKILNVEDNKSLEKTVNELNVVFGG